MNGSLEGASGVVIVCVVIALVVWWVARLVLQTRRTAHAADLDLRALSRRDSAIGTLGRMTGVVACFGLVLPFGDWQVQSALLPVAGVITALVLVLLERWWPQPSGTHRTASASRRGWRGMTSRLAIVLTGLSVIGLLAASVWSVPSGVHGHTLIGIGPDPHDSGRTVQVQVDAFPGWGVVGLVVGAVAVTALVAVVGIQAAINRPAVADVPAALDRQARRATSDRLLRLVGIVAVLSADILFDSTRSAWQLYRQLTGDPTDWLTKSPVPHVVCFVVVLVLLEAGRTRLRTPARQVVGASADTP